MFPAGATDYEISVAVLPEYAEKGYGAEMVETGVTYFLLKGDSKAVLHMSR